MGELKGDEREQELAKLFEKLIIELGDQVQGNYDNLVPVFETSPPIDRTVPLRTTEDGKDIKVIPIDKSIQVPEEFVLPSQSVEEIINKFDDIAVGRCFCRQRRVILGEPCDTEAPMLNCFTFGKSARHTAAQGFAQMGTGQHHYGGMHHGPGWHHQGCGPRGYDSWGNLSEDQLKQIEEERKAFFDATKEIRQQLYQKRLEIRSELAKKNPDAEVAAKLQKEISALKAQMGQKRLDHILKKR